MGDVAASGGYYIAMSGNAIVAQPGTITGSIGVFGGKFSLRGFYDKIGLTKEIVARGRNAALFSEYRPWDERERAKVQSLMSSFYKEFVTKAAKGRAKTFDEVDEVAQGRVWTGTDALRVGLVDRLGGLDDAIALAKEKAGIARGQEVTLVILPERKGFLQALLERQEEVAAGKALPADVRALVHWGSLLDGRSPIARLPFEVRFR
jgi:protease-4